MNMSQSVSRRWTLTEGVSFDDEWDITGPDPERGEVVEVMPVAEHEAAVQVAHNEGIVSGLRRSGLDDDEIALLLERNEGS